ncbi:LuxR family transcriptional regulator [Paenibacillus dendritiformis]|uniref:response regulator n=1 Tax=Paenibacillus dendritiformis TaxID=130049 RepID=UPI001A7ED1FF|nr:response regulator transcription factor [Paenibacillus dendritiformis]MBG9794888.1 LuxR family transcriptional regulator [Paenibacillus dendritiformis]
MKIKVLLVDDHAVVLRGLQFFLTMQPDIDIVGEAMTGTDAIRMVEALRPDVVLMDLMLPQMNGIEATRHIRRHHPATKVLVLTSFVDKDYVVPAVQAGANGYVMKDIMPNELVQAIIDVHRGQAKLHPNVTEQLMSHLSAQQDEALEEDGDPPLELLTSREVEVLRQIARGRSNKEIAAVFNIKEKTVKTHVSNLLSKLGMNARTQAAVYAVKRGLAE